MTSAEQRNRVAIVGVGYSKVERRSPHTLGHLAVSAVPQRSTTPD